MIAINPDENPLTRGQIMDEDKKRDMDAKWKKLATQAVTDEVFKKRLVTDPLTVMNEFGLELPKDAKTRVLGDKSVRLVLPADAGEDLKAEVKWWHGRLDIISEFCKEEKFEKLTTTAALCGEGDY